MTFKLDSRAGDSSPSAQYVIYAEDIDFIKTETKDIALSSFRTYNNNVPQHLSKEEFDVLKNLRINKLLFKNLTKPTL